MRLTKVFKVRIAVTIIIMASITSASMARSSTITRPSSPPRQPTAQDCTALCDWKREMRDPHVVIDANTGEIIDGNTRFAEGDKVQVIFVNKNPFKYSYRISLRSEPLSTAIAAAFLGLIFADLTNFAPRTAAPPSVPAAAGVPCAAVAKARTLAGIGKDASDDLKAIANTLKDPQEKYNKFVKDTEADIPSKPCKDICTDAGSLQSAIETANLSGLAKPLDDLNKLIDKLITDDLPKLEAEIKKEDALPNNAKTCTPAEIDEARKTFASLQEDTKVYKKGVTDYLQLVKSLAKMSEIIKTAFDSGNPFYEIRYPQTAGGPTGVSITICRTNLRVENGKEVCLTPINLQVGESPLSLSAGIGFSTIDDQRIIRQSGLVDNGMGGTKVATIFGRENNSSFKPSGVVMLNGHLSSFNLFGEKASTFALSTGLVISNRNNTTELEFIAGPSIGLLRNTVFATFGFHAARVETLANGFEFGKEVPADLTGDLPLERNWKKGFMFSITYKLR